MGDVAMCVAKHQGLYLTDNTFAQFTLDLPDQSSWCPEIRYVANAGSFAPGLTMTHTV